MSATYPTSDGYPQRPEGAPPLWADRFRDSEEATDIDALRMAGFPRRHRELYDLEGDGPWAAKLNELYEMLGSGMLVVVTGDRGRGKTQLATTLGRLARQRGGRVRYAKAMGFFLDVRSSYNSRDTAERDVIASYVEPDFLVLDEINVRGESAWEQRLLTHVVDRRYDDGRDTLLIGNDDKVDTLDALGESIESRMVECGGVVACEWEDFRSAKRS